MSWMHVITTGHSGSFGFCRLFRLDDPVPIIIYSVTPSGAIELYEEDEENTETPKYCWRVETSCCDI
ncbi:hypothetical protein EVAR_7798_1 [Eumeta japonica]|uniref:Uncharacterized protein n=1 Tax=Eumeta variegata TaxID=151549 RepID=A0A4C1TJ08_EUMVA|nr:hypothetical protein EVAR_7798_1 [Eumeta japonica]